MTQSSFEPKLSRLLRFSSTYTPLQAVALVEPVLDVVLLARQAEQLGLATLLVPPALHWPRGHKAQAGPPVPALPRQGWHTTLDAGAHFLVAGL